MSLDCLLRVYVHKNKQRAFKENTLCADEKSMLNASFLSLERSIRNKIGNIMSHTEGVVYEYVSTIDKDAIVIRIPSDLKSLNEIFARDSDDREVLRNYAIRELHKAVNLMLVQNNVKMRTIRIIYGHTSNETLPCLNIDQWLSLYN